MSSGTEEYRRVAGAHPGRHRRGSADGWTPPVPPRKPSHRHRGENIALPVDPPASGFLPLPQPRTSEARYQEARYPEAHYPAARGTLPMPAPARPAPEPEPEEMDLPHLSAEELAARRTRVSLAPPKRPRPPEPEPEEDVRIYVAPPEDGLGTFDLGSVPASVTPPKTWRKAAWFATGASGAVVIGLLFAGTVLVGKPQLDSARGPAWPGLQGGAPVVTEDPAAGTTGGHGGGVDGHHLSHGARPDRPAGKAAPGPDSASSPDATDGTGQAATGAGATSGDVSGTTSDGPPRKPPVRSAPRETPTPPAWYYSFPPDPQAMGDNTEEFFNNVTTDPNAATEVTTGPLHDKGPQALRQRYAGIAFFVVKNISIDQNRDVTVVTVEATRDDGTKSLEHRTLTFGDGDKITGDGM